MRVDLLDYQEGSIGRLMMMTDDAKFGLGF